MHEFSVAQEILRIVEAERERHGFAKVLAVRLRAGALSGIDPASLELAWEVTRQGTAAEGSRIELELEESHLACRACGATTPTELLPEACPSCGSRELRLVGGMSRLEVTSMEVE
jgi:hydrogenase nickel incorporation protein HypA/HybF